MGMELNSMLPKTGRHAAWQPEDPENQGHRKQATGEFGASVTGLMGETIDKNPNPALVKRTDKDGNPELVNIGDGTIFGQFRSLVAGHGTGVAPAGSNVNVTLGSGG